VLSLISRLFNASVVIGWRNAAQGKIGSGPDLMKIGSDRTVLIGALMKTSAGVASTAIARLRPIKRRRSPISTRRLSPRRCRNKRGGTDDMAPGATTRLSMGPRVDEFSLGQLPRQVSLKNANLQCGKRVFLNA
jgi:hypothetical protein